MTSNIQSRCFVSELSCYAWPKCVYDFSSGFEALGEFALTEVDNQFCSQSISICANLCQLYTAYTDIFSIFNKGLNLVTLFYRTK